MHQSWGGTNSKNAGEVEERAGDAGFLAAAEEAEDYAVQEAGPEEGFLGVVVTLVMQEGDISVDVAEVPAMVAEQVEDRSLEVAEAPESAEMLEEARSLDVAGAQVLAVMLEQVRSMDMTVALLLAVMLEGGKFLGLAEAVVSETCI